MRIACFLIDLNDKIIVGCWSFILGIRFFLSSSEMFPITLNIRFSTQKESSKRTSSAAQIKPKWKYSWINWSTNKSNNYIDSKTIKNKNRHKNVETSKTHSTTFFVNSFAFCWSPVSRLNATILAVASQRSHRVRKVANHVTEKSNWC